MSAAFSCLICPPCSIPTYGFRGICEDMYNLVVRESFEMVPAVGIEPTWSCPRRIVFSQILAVYWALLDLLIVTDDRDNLDDLVLIGSALVSLLIPESIRYLYLMGGKLSIRANPEYEVVLLVFDFCNNIWHSHDINSLCHNRSARIKKFYRPRTQLRRYQRNDCRGSGRLP